MKKELRFSAAIDTGEFDRAIDSMQKKLAKVYEASDRSRMALDTKDRLNKVGLGSPASPQERARADNDDKRARRELDIFVRQQVKDQELINKKLNEQLELKKKLQAANKADEQHLEKITKAEENIARLRARSYAKDAAINSALDRRDMLGGPQGWDRVSRGYAMGGFGGGARALLRQPGYAMGLLGSGLGAAGTLMGAGAELNQYFGQSPRAILAAQGSATSNTTGQAVRDLFGGRAFEQQFYGAERAKAFNMSAKEMASQRTTDSLKLGGAGLGVAGGLIGTIATGGLLPLLLGIGAAGYGGYQMITNPGMRDKALGSLGSTTAAKRYEAGLASQQGQNFQQNLSSLKELDPLKQASFNRYMENMMPNLMMQRTLGMSDFMLNDAFQAGTFGGFTMDQTRSAMGGIVDAGGSTRAGQRLGTFANRMSRDFDATNAPQLIGKLSGAMGSATNTESATVRLLAEGVRLGFNRSEFAEENRRFTSMAADIMSRSGAMSGTQMSDVMGGLSRFVQGNTMGELGGAQSAYGIQQRLTAESGGARGAIQAGALARDPALNKLSRDQRSLLLSMSEEQVRAGGFEIESMAQASGLSVGDFQKKVLGVKEQAVSPRADVDARRDKLRSMMKGRSREELEKDPEFTRLLGEYGAGLSTTTEGYSQMNTQGRRAFAMAQVVGMDNISDADKKLIEEEQDRLRGGKTSTRLADQIVRSQATGDAAFMETMKAFTPALEQSTKGLDTFSQAVTEAARALKDAFASQDMEKVKSATQNLNVLMGVGVPTGQTGSSLLGVQPRSNVPSGSR